MLLSQITLEEVQGLDPSGWIAVGSGFSREDVKALLLNRGIGFVGEAITSAEDLALGLTGISAESVLGATARQEVLRMLLAESRISERMSELKRLRRQSGFFRKLDRAMQSGRMAFAHEAEYGAYVERLEARLGSNPLRDELFTLSRAYEAWLTASGLWDPPLLLRHARDLLSDGWPTSARSARPSKIVFLHAQTLESLELSFWEAVGREVTVHRLSPISSGAATDELPVDACGWSRWHTLDDAADAMTDEWVSGGDVEPLVLISDQPAVRRTLKRALEARGLLLSDPRDPTQLRWDESLKKALQWLELVARDFERVRGIGLLPSLSTDPSEVSAWITEINARGIRQGLRFYQGAKLAPVHEAFSRLANRFGGRKTCAELAQTHLELLSEQCRRHDSGALPAWVLSFFERIWEAFVADTARIGQADRRAPLLYWMERLTERVSQGSPPVASLRPSRGVQQFRLQQARVHLPAPVQTLWIFGMPASWLSGELAGDYWFSEREREVLSGEFAVRSSAQVRQERMAVLRDWLGQASSVRIFDAQYDFDGRERESILPVLREIGLPDGIASEEHGSFASRSRSFELIRDVQPQEVRLAPAQSRVLSATTLDHYSHCAFWGLSSGRWKLWDVQEPEADLWPQIRGTILHAAVEILLTTGVSARDALEKAWERERPKGLLHAERLFEYAKSKMVVVLEAFLEKEKEYRDRSLTRMLAVEEPTELEFPEGVIRGRTDRIDEHADGLFVIDYKTSSALPHGVDMVQEGYGLQLPFYALAVKRKFGRQVLGAQFIELSKKGTRSKGIFVKAYNGKTSGKLTSTTSKKNVLDSDPDSIWSLCEKEIQDHLRSYLAGEFSAKPKKAEDCTRCRYSDLCGHRRRMPDGESSGPGGDES